MFNLCLILTITSVISSVLNILIITVSGHLMYGGNQIAKFHNMLSFKNVLERHTGCIESVPHCAKLCHLNPRCMSFFHKPDGVPMCQLHSVVFSETNEAINAHGWLYYVVETDWCKNTDENGFYYDSVTGSCFRVMDVLATYNQMRNKCKQLNATLLRITSEENETRIVQILEHLKPNIKNFVIQGQFNSTWKFDDGKHMTYFNWDHAYNGQEKADHVIIMTLSVDPALKMNNNTESSWILGKIGNLFPKPASFICEKFET